MKRVEKKKKDNSMSVIYIIIGVACLLMIALLIWNYIDRVNANNELYKFL